MRRGLALLVTIDRETSASGLDPSALYRMLARPLETAEEAFDSYRRAGAVFRRLHDTSTTFPMYEDFRREAFALFKNWATLGTRDLDEIFRVAQDFAELQQLFGKT